MTVKFVTPVKKSMYIFEVIIKDNDQYQELVSNMSRWLYGVTNANDWLFSISHNGECETFDVSASGNYIPESGTYPIDELLVTADIIETGNVIGIINTLRNSKAFVKYNSTINVLRRRELL